MQAPCSLDSDSSVIINPPREPTRTPFFCSRRRRYFSSLQVFNRHRNVHQREDMAAAMRHRQAARARLHRLLHYIRFRSSCVRYRPYYYYAQARNGLNYPLIRNMGILGRYLPPFQNSGFAMEGSVPIIPNTINGTSNHNVNMMMAPIPNNQEEHGNDVLDLSLHL